MLKGTTRQAIVIRILFSLRDDKAVKTVKAAREIFHQEWNDDDIKLMCEHVKKHGADDWASESWENDVDQVYKQLYFLTLKATDFQLALWLEKILGDGEKALKFIMDCEQKLN